MWKKKRNPIKKKVLFLEEKKRKEKHNELRVVKHCCYKLQVSLCVYIFQTWSFLFNFSKKQKRTCGLVVEENSNFVPLLLLSLNIIRITQNPAAHFFIVRAKTSFSSSGRRDAAIKCKFKQKPIGRTLYWSFSHENWLPNSKRRIISLECVPEKGAEPFAIIIIIILK